MQKLSKLIIISHLLFTCLISFNANSSQLPRYLGSEKKFRAYIYNPNDVYRYVGHYTYQGFIEFGASETISTISMGDPSLWLFEHLGNRLFLKPIAQNPDTNMTIITNEKVYHFELTAKTATGIDDQDLIFVAKFIYPDEEDKNIMQFAKKPKSDEPDMRDLSIYNFNYEFTGEPNIAPIKVFDNNIFTYMQFSNNNTDLPAIFSVDSSGFEELVNFRVAGDYVVVERVSSQFTLRNGPDIVCVYNNNRLKSGGVSYSAPSPAFTPKFARPSAGPATSNPTSGSGSPVPGFGNPFGNIQVAPPPGMGGVGMGRPPGI
ncbi:TrbG/VirB9 family P-type conjugative transfer protein [Rickettsiales bacterium]|nr:TrbG/VirB9 family P-type conjugative transfer protein [Rickettsiales bacterium]